MQILHTMSRKLVFACFAFILTVGTKTEDVNDCITPTSEKVYLRSSACGFEMNIPKVCCPVENEITNEAVPENTTKKNIGLIDKRFGEDDSSSVDTMTSTSTPKPNIVTVGITTSPSKTSTSKPKINTAQTTKRTNISKTKSPTKSTLSAQNACGRSKMPKDLITGKGHVNLYDWPWMVRLGYRLLNKKNSPIQWSCHGVLIAESFVLTTANCANDTHHNKHLYMTRLGELEPDADVDALPVDILIEKVLLHESYNKPKFLQNDIALLKLKFPVQFDQHIQPICLPLSSNLRSHNLENSTLIFAGWNSASPCAQQNRKDGLANLRFSVMKNSECQHKYSNLIIIDGGMLCTKIKPNENNPSMDDAGIPLMQLVGNQYYLAGIVSFSDRKCNETNFPRGYTRATHYMTWITENLKKL
ncbi:venom protease-like isoform X2 [Adelges cooleyi]|uniref:venom protease-like isoform X2 n=1 Tax=Adelges cooleyi TaxID=133065 RepID=UPI00217FADCB|nr:venom protease-like isoform X2 [Adelges cooleyi]